ncbi:MAG TPA: O-antigen ligase family protein [Solirubrobacteraceae bacterium]|nr:O-antigen ligase family protein [Solirubrobacteraceae bacterium]
MGSATNSPSAAGRPLLDSLRAAPATVPALAALALMLAWATDQAGFPVTHWAPGALIVLALLGLTLVSVPLRAAELPAPVKVAIACFAAYTALSFLSLLWAGVPGDAWDGANRTLLYLMVFVLFAAWPQRGASAALALCAWVLAMIGLAAFAAFDVDGMSNLSGVLAGGRLSYPTGYPNANAAQWLMVFWPAVLLARSARIPWAVRGLLAGGAVLLGDVALLSQSRGSLYATPVLLVLVFAFVPGRVRTFAALVPVGVGIGVTAPVVLRVGDRVQTAISAQAALHSSGSAQTALDSSGSAQATLHSATSAQAALHGAQAALHSATTVMFAAAACVALVVGAWAAIERRGAFSERTGARVRRGVGVVAVAALIVVVVGGLVATGDPVARVRHGWHTFKGGYGADSSGNRLVSGLGSNRYDFYRVGLDQFKAHPLLGIGVDNFAQQYLRHGRSKETPHYPHSIELRTLAQTGLVGALLALLGLGGALLAGVRAMRAWPGRGGRAEPMRADGPPRPGMSTELAPPGGLRRPGESTRLAPPDELARLGMSTRLAPPDELARLGMSTRLAPPDELARPGESTRLAPPDELARLGMSTKLAPPDELGGVVAAAALAGFVYWVAHGSVDWFWEFAGLGAPAFALLGLACALAPRRSNAVAAGSGAAPARAAADDSSVAPHGLNAAPERLSAAADEPAESKGAGVGFRKEEVLRARDARARSTIKKSITPPVLLAVAALAAAASLGAPWLSQRQVQSAARIWPRAPLPAYSQLNDAARLDPLSAEPYLVAGSIALRFGDLARADQAFAHALRRTPGDAYATLERGAIASRSGQRAQALVLLQRAVSLNPRDPLARQALQRVQRGQRVDLVALNRAILLKAQQLA